MFEEWKSYLSVKTNKINLAVTLFFLIIVLIFLPRFLELMELRDGFAFRDPLLNIFEPIDVTWLTFLIIYTGLIIAVYHLAQTPNLFLLALKVYTLTIIFRMIGMYFLPLDPPEKLIPLDDPFVQFWGSGEILTKDLFFSGHTSTTFIFFLTAYSKNYKLIFLVATILVGVLVLLQHVHYTIDVFAAPFFAFTSFEIAKRIERKLSV
ncbi:MAG: phosphatase PAP2-related protein [Melioribacteraceae bacterium]|nr:phosphatase PAP2-related protein [Melioribacteraceae bacterium]